MLTDPRPFYNTGVYTYTDLCLAHPLESRTPFDIVVNSASALLSIPVTYKPINDVNSPFKRYSGTSAYTTCASSGVIFLIKLVINFVLFICPGTNSWPSDKMATISSVLLDAYTLDAETLDAETLDVDTLDADEFDSDM